ncbi:hypothetical protein ABIC10_008800 [Bradyrhizobium sp. S3.2.12]
MIAGRTLPAERVAVVVTGQRQNAAFVLGFDPPCGIAEESGSILDSARARAPSCG